MCMKVASRSERGRHRHSSERKSAVSMEPACGHARRSQLEKTARAMQNWMKKLAVWGRAVVERGGRDSVEQPAAFRVTLLSLC